jgi:5-methylcytosine-specific restriction endonuclease McrA
LIKTNKICSSCKIDKAASLFTIHPYTTNQGKRMMRLDSRCKECRMIARRVTRLSEDKRLSDAANCKAWRVANHDAALAYRKQYGASEAGKMMRAKHQRKRKAIQRAGIVTLTDKERLRVDQIYEDAVMLTHKLHACVECDDELMINIQVDHIIPLARGGMHHPDNLQLLSARENITKGARVASH